MQLLSDMHLGSVGVDEMIPTLTRVVEDVATMCGPKRNDVAFLKDNTMKIVSKAAPAILKQHSRKKAFIGAAVGADNKAGEDISSRNRASTDQTVNKSGVEGLPPRVPCTCLQDARDQIQVLCNAIDQYLGDLLMKQSALAKRSLNKIEFRDLWLLYKPGELVVTSEAPYQAYRVLHVSGGRPLLTKSSIDTGLGNYRNMYQDANRKSSVSPFRIDCMKFDFDGENFGPVQTVIKILNFDEERRIPDLEVYPLDFGEDSVALRKILLERGLRFAAFRDCRHQKYEGLSLAEPPEKVRTRLRFDEWLLTSLRKDRERGHCRFYTRVSAPHLCGQEAASWY